MFWNVSFKLFSIMSKSIFNLVLNVILIHLEKIYWQLLWKSHFQFYFATNSLMFNLHFKNWIHQIKLKIIFSVLKTFLKVILMLWYVNNQKQIFWIYVSSKTSCQYIFCEFEIHFQNTEMKIQIYKIYFQSFHQIIFRNYQVLKLIFKKYPIIFLN